MCPAVGGAAHVGGGTHGCRPTGDMKVQCISMKLSFRGAKRRGNPFSPHGRGCGAGEYGLPHRCAHRFAMTFFESAAGVGGSSGKSAKRRRWWKKRAGFEEVPRLAATIVDGNRLARRWAIAAPYESSKAPCRAEPVCPAVGGAAHVGGGTHGCRPTGDMKVQCISMKLSFRGAKRRGNPFSPHGRKCGAGEYGLPHRRARRFAMTVFRRCGAYRGRGEGTPPYA